MRRYRLDPDKTMVYFSTSTIVDWLCVFKEEKYFQVIIESLTYCSEKKGLSVLGYVIMLIYIHNNPVKKGFVTKPEDWKYSSARNWICGDDSVMKIDRDVLYE
ncbi:MAG: hypothetical protein DWQ10_12705 [Calditrichaeota bacterium]|nr:MAG: hypothetical protein DWQ10_12705 [Calditrichota bacterium]